jgi:hypothetical protein
MVYTSFQLPEGCAESATANWQLRVPSAGIHSTFSSLTIMQFSAVGALRAVDVRAVVAAPAGPKEGLMNSAYHTHFDVSGAVLFGGCLCGGGAKGRAGAQ